MDTSMANANNAAAQLWSKKRRKAIKEGIPNERASYELLCIGKLLHGEYCISSGFYNTFNYDANIYSVDMDTIRQKPEDWALVMFDYHF